MNSSSARSKDMVSNGNTQANLFEEIGAYQPLKKLKARRNGCKMLCFYQARSCIKSAMSSRMTQDVVMDIPAWAQRHPDSTCMEITGPVKRLALPEALPRKRSKARKMQSSPDLMCGIPPDSMILGCNNNNNGGVRRKRKVRRRRSIVSRTRDEDDGDYVRNRDRSRSLSSSRSSSQESTRSRSRKRPLKGILKRSRRSRRRSQRGRRRSRRRVRFSKKITIWE